MNRIAIVTQYHNSRNYGGTLQAYALCRVLNEMGADCEQLSYHIEHYQKNNQSKANGVRRIVKALLNQIKKKSIIHRAELFDDFLLPRCWSTLASTSGTRRAGRPSCASWPPYNPQNKPYAPPDCPAGHVCIRPVGAYPGVQA